MGSFLKDFPSFSIEANRGLKWAFTIETASNDLAYFLKLWVRFYAGTVVRHPQLCCRNSQILRLRKANAGRKASDPAADLPGGYTVFTHKPVTDSELLAFGFVLSGLAIEPNKRIYCALKGIFFFTFYIF